jgi:hypothetical protein
VCDQKSRAKGFSLITGYQTFQPTHIAAFQATNGLQVFHVWLHCCGRSHQLLDIQFSLEKGWEFPPLIFNVLPGFRYYRKRKLTITIFDPSITAWEYTSISGVFMKLPILHLSHARYIREY